MRRLKWFIFGVGILLCYRTIQAVELGSKMIHVSGDSAIQVPADEVTLTIKVALSTNDKEKLASLAQKNMSNVNELKNLFIAHKIESSDIKFIDYRFDDRREYLDDNHKAMRSVFTVEQVLSGKLRDLTKLPSLILALLNKQYDITGIEFCSSKLAQYKDQARALAVQNAKTKAVLLAQPLGQNVGKALGLIEKESGWYFGGSGSRGGQGDYGAATPTVRTTANLEAKTMGDALSNSIGLITIHAEVSVDFELL